MLFVEAKRFYNHMVALNEDREFNIFSYKTKNCVAVNVLNKNKEIETRKLNFLSSTLKQTIQQEICDNIKTIATLRKRGHQKHGKLKYKSDYHSLCFRQYGATHYIKGSNRIKLQGIKKPIVVRGLSQFIHIEGIEYANFILRNTPNGYYINVVTFTPKENIIKEDSHLEPIGIDFGCQNSFSLSNGEKVNVKVEETERIKRLSRKMARQKKGSNNFNKTKRIIGKEYQKLVNRRNDAANKLVAKLKKHELIVIQDEQLSNWQSSRYGKVIATSILGRVKDKLKKLHNVVVIDKFIPTTRFCNVCGKNVNISLDDRKFSCPHCGYKHEDRDVHAAENMLWIAQTLFKSSVPMGHREIKRVEFLSELEKHFCFDNQETMKHEAEST